MEKLLSVFREVFADLPDDIDKISVLEMDDWDSLGHVTLMSRIEEVYHVKIPPEEYLLYTDFRTIQERLSRLSPQEKES